MPLLDNAFEDLIIYNKVKVDDGYGGTRNTYTEGITIQGAIVCDTSTEGKIAHALGYSSNYTITTRKNINLDYHDVVKRVSDEKIFRVTSDGDDKFTPEEATLDMRQVTAEGWELDG